MKQFYLFFPALFLLMSSCNLDRSELEIVKERSITISDSTWKALALDMVKVSVYKTYNDYLNDVNAKSLEHKEGTGYSFSSDMDKFWLRVKAYRTTSRLYYENKIISYNIYSDPSLEGIVFYPRLEEKPISIKIKSITIDGICPHYSYHGKWDENFADDHLTGPAPDLFIKINDIVFFNFQDAMDYKGDRITFSTPFDMTENLVLHLYDYDFNISENDHLGEVRIELHRILYMKGNKLIEKFCNTGQVTIEVEL